MDAQTLSPRQIAREQRKAAWQAEQAARAAEWAAKRERRILFSVAEAPAVGDWIKLGSGQRARVTEIGRAFPRGGGVVCYAYHDAPVLHEAHASATIMVQCAETVPVQYGPAGVTVTVADLAPRQPAKVKARKAPRASKPASLLRHLARHGGIKDFRGELRSLDAHKHFVPGCGMLVRETGRSLDYAREMAVEAGYLRADADVSDLLDAISEELHGRRVYTLDETFEAHMIEEDLRVECRAEYYATDAAPF